MNKPAISIVLPTHNGRRFIDQSIKSVVNQTCQDWEMIIVNDASTDATPLRIDWWTKQDARILAVHLAQNRTLPGALNDGFARARGDLHTWTSDDNWYHPEALRRMREVLESEKDVAIVYADSTRVNEFGQPRGVGCREHIPVERLYEGCGVGACFLYRAQVTAALGGYDENLFGAEDYDFWLRASLQFRFRWLPENLYFYRAHGATISSTRYHSNARNVEKAVRRWIPLVRWPDDVTRSQAHIEWGVRCLARESGKKCMNRGCANRTG